MVFPVEHHTRNISHQVSSGPESKGEQEGKGDNEVAECGAEVQPFEIDLTQERYM